MQTPSPTATARTSFPSVSTPPQVRRNVGFGINYYFLTLLRLAGFFLFASAVSVLTMYTFSQGPDPGGDNDDPLFSYTLGNLGSLHLANNPARRLRENPVCPRASRIPAGEPELRSGGNHRGNCLCRKRGRKKCVSRQVQQLHRRTGPRCRAPRGERMHWEATLHD